MLEPLKYDFARVIAEIREAVKPGEPLGIPEFDRIASVYRQGFNRVAAMLFIPGAAFHWGTDWQESTFYATQILTGNAWHSGLVQEKMSEFPAILNKRMHEIQVEWQKDDPKWLKRFPGASDAFERVLGHYEGEVREGVFSLVASTLVQSWTTFETMAQDLWEAALNEHPVLLSELRGKRDRGKGNDAEKNDDFDKQVGLNELRRYKYDVSNAMGTILKGRYNFQKLDGIRSAYADAFSGHHDKVESTIRNKSLHLACIVRNLIVHRAAVVDKTFLSQAKSFPLVANYKENERLDFNADLMIEIIRPLIDSGISLLAAVSDWIQSERIIQGAKDKNKIAEGGA